MRSNFNTKKIKTPIPSGKSERKRRCEAEQISRNSKTCFIHIEPYYKAKKHLIRRNINSLKAQIKANIL